MFVCARKRVGRRAGGGRGEAGRTEVVHVGRAHQPLRVRERKGKRCSNLEASQTSAADYYENSLFSIAIYIQKNSPSADVSMNLSGKLTNILLAVILAAQGRTRRSVDR